ncbi:phosphonate C-P lyase system protein PhnG [Paracoccus sp. P2]|uniref:Alpha-D-ribose 1-methylphosphonate 5-triphosphate synthase subunit PhnG n=1 Tax=Paracoccus pantotrophus TaxID=82367 RepID=A0A1I5J099_PARPN|nr:phosphonate C-P lyase system protein PhnG [Paracoccus pantotrophus]MDF3855245.1 phosphonate C-P lyase system protein PhnG [Paracoccus pantotrophus]QFG36425.1 phosphonate C-P lyase system protein PhnG [Paracoccus pantotrophus]QLH16529.1 phosphonate C-P lyase system protein PhnG [Paracoccus pantotrophus]RDD98250.1 phosphonate C-P lyase system protein PhnG [Paracoccus pantotrophus]RKS42989.1 alpha-D-ribose 1-methylphosphonate 5-triphosphate synthase subunit PhnG [Paracoccus pantotrophus]
MSHSPHPETAARRDWISALAKAPPGRLAALLPELPAHEMLRAPEIGTVMVQGRIGGTGAPFNLGEMTVTRCSVRLSGGAVGHACVQGRDKAHAARAAVADALMQTDAAPQIAAQVLGPLRQEAAEARATRAAKAAATRVEFFTMLRGEDA